MKRIRIQAKDLATLTILVENYTGKHSLLSAQTLSFTVSDASILLGESTTNFASNFNIIFNKEGQYLTVTIPGTVARLDFEEMKDNGYEYLNITALYNN